MPNDQHIGQPKVAVVTVHDGGKSYCDFIFPGNVESLTYANKVHIHITPDNCPALRDLPSGELVCKTGRQAGLEEARRQGVDYIFFLDYDCDPDPDTIEKLLALKYPLTAGLACARGNENLAIGHNYEDRVTYERIPLYRYDLIKPMQVDAVGGGFLLVANEIFDEVDFTGYIGPTVFPGRYTGDDEYFELQIFNKLGIRPMLHPDVKSYHYCEDGYAYRCWGIKKLWKK